MILTQSAEAVSGSFYTVWFTVLQFIPAIIAAVGLFIIGWIVGVILYRFVVELVKALRVDEALRKAGVHAAARSAGLDMNVGSFLGTLVMWFVVLVFLIASLEILGLSRVTMFLQQITLYYLPQVIAAVLILIVGALVAGVAQRVVTQAAHSAGSRQARFAGATARWAVWVVTLLAALNQLGVASQFIQTLFAGFVVAVSIAFGLAFGLGGKDAAADAIAHIRKEISHNGERSE